MDCRVIPVSTNINEPIWLKDGLTTIGRDSDNDIQLMSEFVSRHHARLINSPNVCEIEDLNSSNGVFVKNDQVAICGLKGGDEIRIGDFVFLFEECPHETSDDIPQKPREYSDRSRQPTVRIKRHPVDRKFDVKSEIEKSKSSTRPIEPLKPKGDGK